MRHPTFDPDGNPKRRAAKDELSCGECEVQRPDGHGRHCRLRHASTDRCHADDYAGDCRWYTNPNDLDACAKFEATFDRMKALLVGGGDTCASLDTPSLRTPANSQ